MYLTKYENRAKQPLTPAPFFVTLAWRKSGQNWYYSDGNLAASVEGIVSGKRLPETIAYVRITRQSWQQGFLEGEVRAGEFEWQFQWCFRRGELSVKPSQGRALIKEPLGRFLEQRDYQLEPGGDYAFTIRAEL